MPFWNMKPANQEYPYQVELFSRNLGLIDFPEDAHLTPIPVSEDMSSLSAILMNDDYYHYTKIEPQDSYITENSVSDFHRIRSGNDLLTIPARLQNSLCFFLR